jgi:hypothetical protein
MRLAIILLLATLLLSCGGSGSNTSSPTNTNSSTVAPAAIQVITQGTVLRDSDQQDPETGGTPPWKTISVVDLFFDREPKVGETVTVIPLEVSIAPLQLKIVEVEKIEVEELPTTWQVTLANIDSPKIMQIKAPAQRRQDQPFAVCVIYPAVNGAQALKMQTLPANTLPDKVTLKTVTAVIDLNNDQKPDIVMTDYCCDDETKPGTDCDYSCSKTFLKEKEQWKLVSKSNPA